MGQNGQRLLQERLVESGIVTNRIVEPQASGKGRATPRPQLRSVTVNLAESPLGWLYARGHLDERQFRAGERLRADWERSNLDPRVTMRWDAAPAAQGSSSPGIDLTMAQIDARKRFDAAVAAAGPGLSDILWRVVCAGEGMRDAEQALGWPVRAGKLVLTFALDRLADHYRMR